MGTQRWTVIVGAVLGVTWTASLRGWMTQFAGEDSTFTWIGTFACLLLPGAIVGGLLGWAEVLRSTGGTRNRWLIASPLLLGLAPLAIPGAIGNLFATGQGTASLFMVSLAMLAAASTTGRGSLWRRVGFGVVGWAIVPAMIFGAGFDSPKDLWEGVLFASLFCALAFACGIPQRVGARVPGTGAELAKLGGQRAGGGVPS